MEQKGVTRRDFLRGLGVGAGFGIMGTMGASYGFKKSFLPAIHKGTADIGQCKSLKILCVSETSWFDSDQILQDILGCGGLMANQWDIPWPGGELMFDIREDKPGCVSFDNCGGYMSILDIELLDGDHKFILLDTGWRSDFTDERFKDEGVDRMLKNDEFEQLFISHEHIDHFWGLPVACKYNPNITLSIGADYFPIAYEFIERCGFKGKLLDKKTPKHTPGLSPVLDRRGVPIPGVASYYFPIGILLRVFGEQSFFFDIKDVGIVQVTGCCHQGILTFADTSYKVLKNGDKPYGVYGGLHISPFEDWDPAYDDLVMNLGKWGFQKLGCNHCTGYVTAKKFYDVGYPMVLGTCSKGSDTLSAKGQCKYYLGNGDIGTFP